MYIYEHTFVFICINRGQKPKNQIYFSASSPFIHRDPCLEEETEANINIS